MRYKSGMKARKKKKTSSFVFWLFVIVNFLNVMDIYTTKIFTNDFTDWTYEANDWLIANAKAGYLNNWFFDYKIMLILIISASLAITHEYLNYRKKRLFKSLQTLIVIFMLFGIGKLTNVVINNIIFIYQNGMSLF